MMYPKKISKYFMIVDSISMYTHLMFANKTVKDYLIFSLIYDLQHDDCLCYCC